MGKNNPDIIVSKSIKIWQEVGSIVCTFNVNDLLSKLEILLRIILSIYTAWFLCVPVV